MTSRLKVGANYEHYQPVTEKHILELMGGEWRAAEWVGEQCWPHLIGRGSPRGGPSACNRTASQRLGKMVAKGTVESRRIGLKTVYRAARDRG